MKQNVGNNVIIHDFEEHHSSSLAKKKMSVKTKIRFESVPITCIRGIINRKLMHSIMNNCNNVFLKMLKNNIDSLFKENIY
jgi:hypothetical protein